MMRFQFPPDNAADAGPAHRSRLYERFADLLPVVTYAAVLWCVAVFLLLNRAIAEGDPLEKLMVALGGWGEWWGMVGSAFVHIKLWHLGFNMYWLVKFGSLMERGLGSVKTAAFIIGGPQM